MSNKKRQEVSRTARERIRRIQERIRRIDYLCSGTLVTRTKVCGKVGCRCAQDPTARHGPYYEWGYMQEGHQVHRMVTPEQAKVLQRALVNYRTVLRLLRDWEAQTGRALEIGRRPK